LNGNSSAIALLFQPIFLCEEAQHPKLSYNGVTHCRLPDVSEEEMERGLNSEALAQVGTNNVAIGGGVTYPEYLKVS